MLIKDVKFIKPMIKIIFENMYICEYINHRIKQNLWLNSLILRAYF